MANTNKRTNEGVKAAGEFIATTMEKIPEIAKDPDLKVAVINHLKETWLPLVRAGVRSKTSPYDSYKKSKGNAKTIRDTAIKEISKFTDLSPKSIEKLGTVIGGIASLVEKGEVKVPPTSIVDEDNFKVKIGGGVNLQENEYGGVGFGEWTDKDYGEYSLELQSVYGNLLNGFNAKARIPTGREGVDFTARASGDSKNFDIGVGGQWQVGDNGILSGEVGGNLDEQRAGVVYTTDLDKITEAFESLFRKRGGKVTKKRKKRKTKKYTKGCAVRTAKY